MKKILFTIILGTTLISCNKESSDDVNQDKIYTDYEMFYNANTDKTVVVARFKFGDITGTNLELDNGASVLFGSDTLYYNVWYTGHAKEYAGQIPAGTFTYKDTDGNTFTNTAPSGQSIAFDPAFTTITKSIANTLTWVGSTLAANEAVGVFVGTNWTWGQDALFYQDLDGSSDIIMGVSQMNNLAEGPATVFMDRSINLDVSQGTSKGGKIRYRYRTLNQNVTVNP